MPASTKDLFVFLESLGIATTTVNHEPLFTVEQSRGLYKELSGAHTKNLFLVDRKGRLFLVVAEQSAEIDLGRLHHRLGASGRLSFGKPDMMRTMLGIEPGSVTAFAVINDTEKRVEVILDEPLMSADAINCHPLVNTGTTQIATADLLRFLKATGHEPRIIAVSGPAPDGA